MADVDTLPIVNALENLRASNDADSDRLQKSIRSGLLNVVKSVDRLNASIISAVSGQRQNPFEGQDQLAQSVERSNTSTLAEFSQIAQAFLQFGTRENTALQAKLSGQVEEQTEVMAQAQMGQTQLFGTMGKMLGQMNKKLADIAAHGLRSLQYQRVRMAEKLNPGYDFSKDRQAILKDMSNTIVKTLTRQNKNVGYSDQLISELESSVERVNIALGIQQNSLNGLNQTIEQTSADEEQSVRENTQTTAANTKAIKQNIQNDQKQVGWLTKLHKIIKKDLVENIKDMVKNFKGGMFGGSLVGGGIGALFGGPMGAGIGALLGGGVGGVVSMVASRAAMSVLMNPYVLAGLTAATAGYFGIEKFKEDLKKRMEAMPDETSFQAGTNVAGEYVSKGLGYGVGVPLDYLNEKLFGQQPLFQKAIEDATLAAFNRVAENIGDLQRWIESKDLRNPFTSSPDGQDRGWLGNYWENLKRDLNSIEDAIKGWVLKELEASREGLKELWNESWGPDITGLYFRTKPKVDPNKVYDGNDMPPTPPDILPKPQKNPAPVINKQSREQLMEMAKGNFSPVPQTGGGSIINNLVDQRSSRSYFAEVEAGKENASMVPDPFSSFYGKYGFR